MSLAAHQVCGKPLTQNYTLSAEQAQRLFELSNRHDIAHIVGSGAAAGGMIQDADVSKKFSDSVLAAVCRSERMSYELERIKDVLNNAHIRFIPLKGAVIRDYYPEPWLRTSCDIDILVHEDKADKAAHIISDRLGFEYNSKNYHDIFLRSRSGVHLELHFSIKEDMDAIDGLLSECFEYSTVYKEYEYRFSNEYFMFHQFAHAYYHFMHGGCGVRPVLDIWVLGRKLPLDRGELDRLLRMCKIDVFAAQIERLAQVWFENAEHTGLTRRLEEYIINGGAYGTIINSIKVDQVKRGGKFNYLMARLFLPYEQLAKNYPSLNGRRILTPAYNVFRWADVIRSGRANSGIRRLKAGMSTADTEMRELEEMLDMLNGHTEHKK